MLFKQYSLSDPVKKYKRNGVAKYFSSSQGWRK